MYIDEVLKVASTGSPSVSPETPSYTVIPTCVLMALPTQLDTALTPTQDPTNLSGRPLSISGVATTNMNSVLSVSSLPVHLPKIGLATFPFRADTAGAHPTIPSHGAGYRIFTQFLPKRAFVSKII